MRDGEEANVTTHGKNEDNHMRMVSVMQNKVKVGFDTNLIKLNTIKHHERVIKNDRKLYIKNLEDPNKVNLCYI